MTTLTTQQSATIRAILHDRRAHHLHRETEFTGTLYGYTVDSDTAPCEYTITVDDDPDLCARLDRVLINRDIHIVALAPLPGD